MDERQLKEIAWALLYARLFNHGANEHNTLLVTAELATQAGYQLTIDMSATVDAEPEPGVDFQVGVFCCKVVLMKDDQPVLALGDLADDAR